MYVCTCVDVCMYVCMYVCICMCDEPRQCNLVLHCSLI